MAVEDVTCGRRAHSMVREDAMAAAAAAASNSSRPLMRQALENGGSENSVCRTTPGMLKLQDGEEDALEADLLDREQGGREAEAQARQWSWSGRDSRVARRPKSNL